MMEIRADVFLLIKNPTIPAERMLKKFYFAENTETGQGVLKQLDIMKYYFEEATEKEKRIIEKIIPYHDVEELTSEHIRDCVYILVM